MKEIGSQNIILFSGTSLSVRAPRTLESKGSLSVDRFYDFFLNS